MRRSFPLNPHRRRFIAHAAGALTACLYNAPVSTAEAPPETHRVRLHFYPVACIAPLHVVEQFLAAEGFTDVGFVGPYAGVGVGPGKADFDMMAVCSIMMALDAGSDFVTLMGTHLGCYELFGSRRVRSIRNLSGATVAVDGLGGAQHAMLSSMAAYVGVDPRKDIYWLTQLPPVGKQLYVDGKVDAYLGFPPETQELRARGIGPVIVNTATDKPWSQYACCMLLTSREFLQRYPRATKRVMRALIRAANLCSSEPERVARSLVERRVVERYEYGLQTLLESNFGSWRTHDPADAMRFHGVRLHDVGLIRSSPKELIARGSDWRFLEELRLELKA
jgi:NitT/TauT family transport system substrate-binding protein